MRQALSAAPALATILAAFAPSCTSFAAPNGQDVIGSGINDAGQIVGYALIPSIGLGPSVGGFIATPLANTVSEPPSLALLGAVTWCVWLSRSRLGSRRCESAGGLPEPFEISSGATLKPGV